MLSKQEIIETYRNRAANYDWTANLYYLVGYREQHYRKLAAGRLQLSRGETVLELGCGTGLNFRYLRNQVGSEGRIIGLDMTDAMLEQARDRCDEQGWNNVTLRQRDMTESDYPDNLDAIISTFTLSLSPNIEKVISKSYTALRSGGHMVVLDLREPSNWLSILRPLIIPVERPFGVTKELVKARPWKKVETTMRNCFDEQDLQQLFGGFSFLAVGKKG